MHFGSSHLSGAKMTNEVLRANHLIEPHCGAFVRLLRHLFSFRNIGIFIARTLKKKCSINAGPICSPEIGGTNTRGNSPNGTCNWKAANWCAPTKLTVFGNSTGFMTEENRDS